MESTREKLRKLDDQSRKFKSATEFHEVENSH